MRTAILAAAIAVSLFLPTSGLAEGCTPTTTDAEVDTGHVALADEARVYVDLVCAPTCLDLVNVWVYVESNGIDGLQRQDEAHDDTCGGQIAGDTLIY